MIARRHLAAYAIAAALWSPASAAPAEDAAPPAVSPQAVEAMRLLASQDAYQRKLGFLRLEALREPGTLEAIRAHLGSRDPETRAYSLRAVAAIEGPPAVPLLLTALKTDKEPRVRRAALLGLEPFVPSDPAILPALLRALVDRSTEIRITAVDVVSRIDDPRAREAILRRHKREQRRDVRRVLELAKLRLGG